MPVVKVNAKIKMLDYPEDDLGDKVDELIASVEAAVASFGTVKGVKATIKRPDGSNTEVREGGSFPPPPALADIQHEEEKMPEWLVEWLNADHDEADPH